MPMFFNGSKWMNIESEGSKVSKKVKNKRNFKILKFKVTVEIM